MEEKAASQTLSSNGGKREEAAFQRSKRLLQKNCVLTHYDTAKPTTTTDRCKPVWDRCGNLAHVEADVRRTPNCIRFTHNEAPVRWTMPSTKKKVCRSSFGLKRFHKQLHGRQFTIVTDHKPLLGLFWRSQARKPDGHSTSSKMATWSCQRTATT